MHCQTEILVSIVMYIKSEACLSIYSIYLLFCEVRNLYKPLCF